MRRSSYVASLAVCLAAAVANAGFSVVETESFDGGVFTNPFFQHQLKFDFCCYEIFNCNDEGPPIMIDCALYFFPNSDFITFDVPSGATVRSAGMVVQDFEGGFVGDAPTSAVFVHGIDDTALMHAPSIGAPVVLGATAETIGIGGRPLGDITAIEIQSSNSGNSVFPTIVGALIDDLRVELDGVCLSDTNDDAAVDVDDIVNVILTWGPCDEDCPTDLNGDMQVDVDDLVAVILAFGSCDGA